MAKNRIFIVPSGDSLSRMLGIEESRGLVYEGDAGYGVCLVWPTPVLTPAKFHDSGAKDFAATGAHNPIKYYFREDSFDPVSRIRRGRFYKNSGSSGVIWHALVNGLVTIQRVSEIDSNGCQPVSVIDCYACNISGELEILKISYPVVALGNGKSTSIWSIVSVEANFNGEDLVTLKLRQSLGALPELDVAKVPEHNRPNIEEALQTLEDDYHLASPESVVDRANEAATRIMNTFLDMKGRDSQDSLHKAITEAGKLGQPDKKEAVRDAADIVRLLHGRTKYAVQRDKNTRDVREQDAELAVQCIGVMLCDLGWAAWR